MSNVLKWYEGCNAYIENHLEEFLDSFYQASNPIAIPPDGFRVNPCPVCDHNDCATFSREKGLVNCFSCGWSGNLVSSYIEYATDKTDKRLSDIRKEIGNFCGLTYPVPDSKEEREKERQRERKYEIRRIAVDFYVQQLRYCEKTYEFEGRDIGPLDYLRSERGHSEETLVSFKVGFSINYFDIRDMLMEEGYTAEEIKDSKVWCPQGVFIYPQWNPITKNIERINTKNPFGVTMKNKAGKEVEVKGFSTKGGEKVMGFAPGYSFKKPGILVEGENDAQTVYERGGETGKNVAWLAGNPGPEQFKIFRNSKAPIYLMMDNDDAGKEYIRVINDAIPSKVVEVLTYDRKYNDPDIYYRQCEARKTIDELMLSAKELETDKFDVIKDGEVWTMENRHRQLVFTMDYIDSNRGSIFGSAKIYKDGQLKDSRGGASLTSLPAAFKPLSILLNEEIEAYYNAPKGMLHELSDKDLIEMFKFSKYKNDIVKAFAYKIFHSEKDMEEQIISLRENIGRDAIDEVLKEINDIQNKDVLDSLVTIPTLKLSHFFSLKNDDAFFYFTAVKYDGDTIRRIPYLLRNDGGLIRLDLLKRKDSQCLLLIDNKYELPEEVNEAKMKLSECSLVADWANRYHDGEVKNSEISPYKIVKEIEKYVRKFYYHTDDNIFKVISLYIYGTYFYEMFGQYPYLFLNGQKGSGKTILDIVIYMFALNAKLAVNISEAALYRIVALEGGTMILDEIENLTSRSKTQDSLMATLLKGGYQKGGKAYRYNKDLNASEGFDVFSPKVISNINGIEDVIEDRCIRIDTQRMKVKKGFKLEDPKYYQQERLDEVRDVTSKCVLSALKHFQKLNDIYNNSQMMTNNARLTQLLTPILSLARFVDASKDNPGLVDVDFKTVDPETITGEFTKSFMEYYESKIVVVKDEIESNTPEGVLKSVVSKIAHELADFVDESAYEYIDSAHHRYTNEIKYDKETGEFILDALHVKVFMEETMTNWKVSLPEVHGFMKKVFNISSTKRRDVKLENSPAIQSQFGDNKKLKVQHYVFNVKEFVPTMNNFTKSEDDISVESVGTPF